MADIFLSYNREDQARAKLFAEAFEAQGFKVWWDVGLRAGEAYDEVTETALRKAKAVVVLWSKKSVVSRWVRAEATLADRNKTLVPCMIEACERPIMFELTQTAELAHWNGDAGDPAWNAFLADVGVKLGDERVSLINPSRTAPAAPVRNNNLKAGRGELYGRADDVATLCTAIAVHRLVTIVGPGGVGKSSVAHHVSSSRSGAFADGVWWVELASVTDGALVPDAISRALGLTLQAGLAELIDQIRDRRLLLILDNCEHVIAAAAEAAEAIVTGAPYVHVLATSQERLRCQLEHLYRLPPLATPGGSERDGSDALDLFAVRAQAVSPGFALTPENTEAVAQICRTLDGLPLAIELAAARLPLLGLDGLRKRLEDRFRVLANASRTAPSRQRTLRSALEWSHALLTAPEQRFFARLGVFVGWFDLAGMEQVCADAAIESAEVMDLANSLLDKSLLSPAVQEPPRYRLLETPRAFAMEQLAKADDARSVRARHAGLMRARLLTAQDAQWTPRASVAIDLVVQDISNLRAALRWAADPDGDREMLIALAGTGSVVWSQAGAEAEGLAWCETALKAVREDTQPALEGELLVAFARLSHQIDAAREVAALERAVALFGAQFERQGQFIALGALAKKNVWRRDLDGAERAINAAQSIYDPAWPTALQTSILQARTYLLELQGRPEEGESHMHELMAILRALGDPEKIDLGMIELAENYMVQGKLEEAAALRQAVHDRVGRKTPDTYNLGNLCATYTQMDRLDAALACAREAADGLKRSHKIKVFLEHIGLLCCKRGRLVEGAHLIALSDAHYRESGFDREMSEARARAQAERLLRAAFPDQRLAELFVQGRAMSISDAVDAGLSA